MRAMAAADITAVVIHPATLSKFPLTRLPITSRLLETFMFKTSRGARKPSPDRTSHRETQIMRFKKRDLLLSVLVGTGLHLLNSLRERSVRAETLFSYLGCLPFIWHR